MDHKLHSRLLLVCPFTHNVCIQKNRRNKPSKPCHLLNIPRAIWPHPLVHQKLNHKEEYGRQVVVYLHHQDLHNDVCVYADE